MQTITHKANLLVVDDELEILSSLRGLLRREFNLFTAQSGKEALAILRQEDIHVIMTDQRMPEMTGAELLSEAQVHSADAVRLIFTGYADIKAVVEAVNNGKLFRYITKPWDPDDLVEVLHQAADEYARKQRQAALFADLQSSFEQWIQQAEQSPANHSAFDVAEAKLLSARLAQEIQAAGRGQAAPVKSV